VESEISNGQTVSEFVVALIVVLTVSMDAGTRQKLGGGSWRAFWSISAGDHSAPRGGRFAGRYCPRRAWP